jgi:pimeloyl-ACP methyl ester carboxylesterase
VAADGIVLIHAFPMDGSMWSAQADALGEQTTVLAPNLPGFGGEPGAGEVLTMAEAAERVAEAANSAGLRRALVCGLSMGGYVALALWRQHPELVAGLVLANTRADADDEAARERRKALAARQRAEGNEFLAESPPPLLSGGALPELWASVKTTIARQPPGSIAAAALGMAGRADSTGDLGKINVPTLVITSSEDALIAPAITSLMAPAIRDDNPVVYLHHYLLTLEHGEVPDGEYLVPFGKAAVRREGGDVTIVATGWTVDRALGAAERLAADGIEAEVIDPRTLAPLDTQTILESVDKTGHLVLVDQATRHASVSTVIAGEVAEHGFSSLKAPIVQVTALDATIPYSEPLEAWVMPNEDKIVAAAGQVLGSSRVTA